MILVKGFCFLAIYLKQFVFVSLFVFQVFHDFIIDFLLNIKNSKYLTFSQ